MPLIKKWLDSLEESETLRGLSLKLEQKVSFVIYFKNEIIQVKILLLLCESLYSFNCFCFCFSGINNFFYNYWSHLEEMNRFQGNLKEIRMLINTYEMLQDYWLILFVSMIPIKVFLFSLMPNCKSTEKFKVH